MGVLAMDMAYHNEAVGYAGSPWFAHNMNGGNWGINVLFDDGHVQWFGMSGAAWPCKYGPGTNTWHGDVWICGPGEVKGFRY